MSKKFSWLINVKSTWEKRIESFDNAKDIAEELEKEIQKGRLEKENLDEKAVNAFIQYYAVDHGIELDEKLSWHSCRI